MNCPPMFLRLVGSRGRRCNTRNARYQKPSPMPVFSSFFFLGGGSRGFVVFVSCCFAGLSSAPWAAENADTEPFVTEARRFYEKFACAIFFCAALRVVFVFFAFVFRFNISKRKNNKKKEKNHHHHHHHQQQQQQQQQQQLLELLPLLILNS